MISARLELNLSTVYHLLNTLASEGFVSRRASNQNYVLGPKIPFLNSAFLRTISVSPILSEFMQTLHERSAETTYLGQWLDNDLVISGIIEGVQPVRVQSLYVGYRGDAHAMALGKVLLAYRPEAELSTFLLNHPLTGRTGATITDALYFRSHLLHVRASGFALDVEEFAAELCCIAAPVRHPDGTVSAAIGISVPCSRYNRTPERFVELVMQVAQEAGKALGQSDVIHPPVPW
ncbi:MAG: IclR family transcriptional regulator [Herpetosiphon sp.]